MSPIVDDVILITSLVRLLLNLLISSSKCHTNLGTTFSNFIPSTKTWTITSKTNTIFNFHTSFFQQKYDFVRIHVTMFIQAIVSCKYEFSFHTRKRYRSTSPYINFQILNLLTNVNSYFPNR